MRPCPIRGLREQCPTLPNRTPSAPREAKRLICWRVSGEPGTPSSRACMLGWTIQRERLRATLRGVMAEPKPRKPAEPGKPEEKKRAFVILIGGPGRFLKCDPQHDGTWTNYLIPVQLATQRDQIGKKSDETIYWLVYAPAYEDRWAADTAYVRQPDPPNKVLNRHDSRKKDLTKIETQKANDYLGRVAQVASSLGVTLKLIRKKQEFWDFLKHLPDQSLSRLWYVGHAAGFGLMLTIAHGPLTSKQQCAAQANDFSVDVITVSELQTHETLLKSKFVNTGASSQFYGCYTEGFAQQLNKIAGVAAEGAIMKIDFGVINDATTIPNILERLRKSNPDTQWTEHH